MKTKHSPFPFTSESGFTIVEVLVALAMFTVAVVGFMGLQYVSTKGNSNANIITVGSYWGTDQTERLVSCPFDDNFVQGSKTGTDHNTANNNIEIFPRGNYTTSYSVYSKSPTRNMKTIPISVQYSDRGRNKNIPLIYYKADTI